MRKFDFCFVGKCKDAAFLALEQKYAERINHFVPAEVQIIKDAKNTSPQDGKFKETQNLISVLKPTDTVVICDERGQTYSSVKFSQKIQNWLETGKRVIFAIGGAYGFEKELILQKHEVLRLSDFTLPHELARVVLLEQVYRAITILKGSSYHHK